MEITNTMKTLLASTLIALSLIAPANAQEDTCQTKEEFIELYKATPPLSNDTTVEIYDGEKGQKLIHILKALTGLPSSTEGDSVVVVDQPNTNAAAVMIMKEDCLVIGGPLPDQVLYGITTKLFGESI